MTKIAIVGGRVVDPSNQVDEVANLYIADEKIVAISAKELADFEADIVLDANNKIVAPGLVDLNADIANRLDQFEKTVQMAAEVGITHFSADAFTAKRCLLAPEIDYYTQLARQAHLPKVYFKGALTQELQGNRLNELMLLSEAGCIGFSNGQNSLLNNSVRLRCYDYAAMLGLKIFITPQDASLSPKGAMHQGARNIHLGLPGNPVLSEQLALSTELHLINATGISSHFCGISAAKSLEILTVHPSKTTFDVAIYQLYLTDQDVELSNGFYHVHPPLRTEKDKTALRAGVKKEIVNALSSYHIKLSKQAKEVPFQDSEPGIAAWPVLLPLSLQLAREENISLLQIIDLISTQPAKILGIDAGHLNQGARANLIIFDPERKWRLSQTDLLRYGVNNPFYDKDLEGLICWTLIDGQIVFENGNLP